MGASVPPTCCRVGRSGVFPVVGTGTFGSGEGSADRLPRLGDGVGVFPGPVDPDTDLPGAPGDAGGDMQHEVAEGGDLSMGQLGCGGEAEKFGPAHQIGGGQKGFQPRGVFVPAMGV